ncbi:MAG: hypothetical protein NTZ10_02345 [Candidatus Saganbacteria bacterium]|nr:hypothetical protein [Candidatus Saganbacteria bacterium]
MATSIVAAENPMATHVKLGNAAGFGNFIRINKNRVGIKALETYFDHDNKAKRPDIIRTVLNSFDPSRRKSSFNGPSYNTDIVAFACMASPIHISEALNDGSVHPEKISGVLAHELMPVAFGMALLGTMEQSARQSLLRPTLNIIKGRDVDQNTANWFHFDTGQGMITRHQDLIANAIGLSLALDTEYSKIEHEEHKSHSLHVGVTDGKQLPLQVFIRGVSLFQEVHGEERWTGLMERFDVPTALLYLSTSDIDRFYNLGGVFGLFNLITGKLQFGD